MIEHFGKIDELIGSKEISFLVTSCIEEEGGTFLRNLKEQVTTQILQKITKKCVDNLQRARSIPSRYLSTQNQPSSALPYVSTVVEPFTKFLSKKNTVLCVSEQDIIHWKDILFADVCSQFQKVSEEILNTFSGAQMFSQSKKKNEDGNVSIRDKIFAQIVMDVTQFGNLLKSTNVDIEHFQPYQNLLLSIQQQREKK